MAYHKFALNLHVEVDSDDPDFPADLINMTAAELSEEIARLGRRSAYAHFMLQQKSELFQRYLKPHWTPSDTGGKCEECGRLTYYKWDYKYHCIFPRPERDIPDPNGVAVCMDEKGQSLKIRDKAEELLAKYLNKNRP